MDSFTKEVNWPAANIETGTKQGTNHFTNGLWALFHALSVSSAPSRQKPYDIMEGISSFVGDFFRYFDRIAGLCVVHRKCFKITRISVVLRKGNRVTRGRRGACVDNIEHER